MASREELHTLVDSLPEGVFETVHQMLTRFQVWPPPRPARPPEFERFQAEARQRHHQSVQAKHGIFSMTGGSSFDPTRGSGSAGTTFWEDDALITETLRLHKGHQLLIKE